MINEILHKKKLSKNIYEFKIENEIISSFAKPGQFLIILLNEKSERIPITIANINKPNKNITIVIQNVGFTTNKIINLNKGDIIKNIVGPLGNPSNITYKKGITILIGGGLGIAAISSQIKNYKSAGNEIISIIGAKNYKLLFYEKKIRFYSDKLFVTTDDGSKGYKGYVTDMLNKVISKYKEQISCVVIIGPTILMKKAVEILKPFNYIEIIVSLNSLMIDGIGMCGCCRVSINKKIKFSCVDGPEFDGRLVDFDTLINRLTMYE